jgi:hypothetical protein
VCERRDKADFLRSYGSSVIPEDYRSHFWEGNRFCQKKSPRVVILYVLGNISYQSTADDPPGASPNYCRPRGHTIDTGFVSALPCRGLKVPPGLCLV